MTRISKYILPGWIFLLVFGCAQLPDYAKPQLGLPDFVQGISEKGFTYRQLTVGDFQAIRLPEKSAPHAKSLNARICTNIRLTKD